MNSIDLEILSMFKEIAKRFVEMQKEVLSGTNIGFTELKILTLLGVSGKYSQTNLSDYCGIDKPTISRVINKMYEQNLVQRQEDCNDRRITYISLTDKGKLLLENIRSSLLVSYKNYFNCVSNNDKKTFIELLNRTLNKEKIC